MTSGKVDTIPIQQSSNNIDINLYLSCINTVTIQFIHQYCTMLLLLNLVPILISLYQYWSAEVNNFNWILCRQYTVPIVAIHIVTKVMYKMQLCLRHLLSFNLYRCWPLFKVACCRALVYKGNCSSDVCWCSCYDFVWQLKQGTVTLIEYRFLTASSKRLKSLN